MYTNLRGIAAEELLSRHRDLWRVEESFRITKHDLRVRPIFHWTPRRIRAHLAIAFMAFACVRHLDHRLRMRKAGLSPRRVRQALPRRQRSILGDGERRWAVPSNPTGEARTLYGVMGLPLPTTPARMP